MLDQSLHRFGPFLIIRTLGRGGMGEVFVARTPWDAQPLAALKRLRPDVARVPTFAERFQHESELAVRLEHANVVATLDVGSVDGQLYVASELILGKDIGLIADRLRERGQGGPAAVAIRILMDALGGLAYVHGVAEPDGRRLELVHRDITPGNLLVGYDGSARVADFGLAKSLLTEKSNLTQHGEILGTPHYLAPEVIRGDRATPASDLYGIGAVIYRFLTGVAPHHGTTTEVLLKVLQEEPRPLSDLRPDLPPWLVTFVHRLLEKDPGRRPRDAADLAEQLIHDAKRAELFVARAQVGQWLVSLFEIEHAEEVDEYERIAALEPEAQAARPEGTVVLARPAQASRLHMPTPEAFREYEQSGGTELDLSEMAVAAELEGDAELPTRAVTVFPGGNLVFEDGTALEREEPGREEDTLDPDTYDDSPPPADPANAATQWGEVVAQGAAPTVPPRPAREPSTGEQASALPGFVDGHHGQPRKGSYDPGITSPDPPGSEPGLRRPRNPDSVVVSPVAGSNPALEAHGAERGPDEWFAATAQRRESIEPERAAPPKPRAVQERSRVPPRARGEERPRPSTSNPDTSAERRSGRPERSRDAVAFPAPPPEAGSRNLVMAGALLAAAVALGVGIGAMVATVKARREAPAPVQTERQALAQRFIALKARMEGRLEKGQEVPQRVERLATDAASALLQEDEEAARLYLDEMERLLAEAP